MGVAIPSSSPEEAVVLTKERKVQFNNNLQGSEASTAATGSEDQGKGGSDCPDDEAAVNPDQNELTWGESLHAVIDSAFGDSWSACSYSCITCSTASSGSTTEQNVSVLAELQGMPPVSVVDGEESLDGSETDMSEMSSNDDDDVTLNALADNKLQVVKTSIEAVVLPNDAVAIWQAVCSPNEESDGDSIEAIDCSDAEHPMIVVSN